MLESRMPALPFCSFDWLLPWWRHFNTQRKLLRDELFVCTFRAPDGVLLGIAPLMLTQRPGLGPVRFRQLQFFGADPNITEVRGVVAPPENIGYIYSSLLDHFAQLPKVWDSMNLSGVPGDDARLERRINGTFAVNYWAADTLN